MLKSLWPTRRKRKRHEQGIALVMTIAVMALLFILAFTFAATAYYAARASNLSQEVIKARLQSQSGFQRVHAALSVEFQDSGNPANLFPATKKTTSNRYELDTDGEAGADRVYWAEANNAESHGLHDALHVQFNGVDFTPSSFVDDNVVGWQHVMSDDPSDPRIVARLAYVVIDESGKIDPSAVTGDTPEGSEVRRGRDPQEINLRNLMSSTALADSFLLPGSYNPAPPTWFSYRHILKANSLASSNSDEVISKTIFTESYDVEAFNDGVTDRHRFDLTNTDWNGFANTLAANPAGHNIDTPAGLFWNSDGTISNPSGGINWLHYSGLTSAEKHQIMANLIDYCDTDSTATTDNPNNPTYVGLERVPYINELNIDCLISSSAPNVYNLSLSVTPELVNIYEVAVGSATAILTVQLEISGSSLPTSPTTQTYTWSPGTQPLASIAAKSYDTPNALTSGYVLSASTLTGLTIKMKSAKLTDAAGNLWDFARSNVSPAGSLSFAGDALADISVEVNDPRQNLDAIEWTWTAWTAGGGGGSLNANNAVCVPYTDPPDAARDLETNASEPWDVSTAYIRNAPLVSLWELGAIHRASKWRTINLWKYRLTTNPYRGLGDYDKGDANILDQVKLAADKEVKGRVNINTHSNVVLRALLTGMHVGANYATPGVGGSTLTTTHANAIIGTLTTAAEGQFLWENGADSSSDSSPFRNRGQLADVEALVNVKSVAGSFGTAQDTDRKREELVGVLSCLATTRANYFTVFIAAQSILDVRGKDGATWGVYNPGVDKILAQQNSLALFYRDAFTNKFKVVRFEYLTD